MTRNHDAVNVNMNVTLGVTLRLEHEIKAETLREAAELLYSDAGPDHPLSTAAWLRERAERMTPTPPEATP